MKYTCIIPQFSAYKAGLFGKIDAIDLMLFDAFKDFANSSRCEKRFYDGKPWFWIDYGMIIEEIPFSGLTTKDAIYRRMKKLEQVQIIEFCPMNQSWNRSFFGWGKTYDALIISKLPTDEKPEVTRGNLRTKNRRGTDEKPELPTDEKPNDHNTINNQTTKPKTLAENKFPQPDENGLLVTIIQGHGEILPPVEKKKKKVAPGAGDGVIQAMVTAFETEHKNHFKDAGGEWIGFTWQAKEFPALKSIQKELEKRYREKMNADPTPENIVESWSMFLRKAAKCDRFILDNLFTPSKIWGQFQSIVQKIHTNNGRPPSATSNSGKLDQNQRNALALESMVRDIKEGRF